jgi:hypothetical protein
MLMISVARGALAETSVRLYRTLKPTAPAPGGLGSGAGIVARGIGRRRHANIRRRISRGRLCRRRP